MGYYTENMDKLQAKGMQASESEEQIALFSWAEVSKHKYPELELMYHVPNGGSRSKITAKRLKAEGVKAGVPDIHLPVARGQYHGMYIEMKRQHEGKLSEKQRNWLQALGEQGYMAIVCRGWQEAVREIENYLNIE